uniref:Uncharacterized protein n=1 Tax=Avena sativa TaxID=4498 RepID=A0ACD5U881_AVESA
MENRRGGWGFVARDFDGSVRGAGAGKIRFTASPIYTEAVACVEALQAAAEWGMEKIQIETDSKILVEALSNNKHDLSPEGVIFRDIRFFIRLNFISVEISFAPRICNKLAHELAALGSSHEAGRQYWVDSVPAAVRSIAASESAEPA